MSPENENAENSEIKEEVQEGPAESPGHPQEAEEFDLKVENALEETKWRRQNLIGFAIQGSAINVTGDKEAKRIARNAILLADAVMEEENK